LRAEGFHRSGRMDSLLLDGEEGGNPTQVPRGGKREREGILVIKGSSLSDFPFRKKKEDFMACVEGGGGRESLSGTKTCK